MEGGEEEGALVHEVAEGEDELVAEAAIMDMTIDANAEEELGQRRHL